MYSTSYVKNTMSIAVRKVVLALIKLQDTFVPWTFKCSKDQRGFLRLIWNIKILGLFLNVHRLDLYTEHISSCDIPSVVGVTDCTNIPIRTLLGEHKGDYLKFISHQPSGIWSYHVFDLTCWLAYINTLLNTLIIIFIKTSSDIQVIKDIVGGDFFYSASKLK